MKMVPSRGYWLLFTVSAALVVLGDVPSARASCGDYVTIRGEEKAQRERKLDHLRSPFSADHPAPLPRTCSGPSCSQKQLPFGPPASAPFSLEDDRWSNGWGAETQPAGTLCWLMLTSAALQPLDRQSPVYHPPR